MYIYACIYMCMYAAPAATTAGMCYCLNNSRYVLLS